MKVRLVLWVDMPASPKPASSQAFLSILSTVENFAENFVEAILEAGFIWSAEADSYYAMAKAAMKVPFKQVRPLADKVKSLGIRLRWGDALFPVK